MKSLSDSIRKKSTGLFYGRAKYPYHHYRDTRLCVILDFGHCLILKWIKCYSVFSWFETLYYSKVMKYSELTRLICLI